MEYTMFGKTGMKISKLGLGGAPLAGDFGKTDEREVQRMIHEALDAGMTFIDTAPKYGFGESERRIGQAIVGRRDKIVLTTKAIRSDLTYDYQSTIQSVEDSLQRLQTDWIDLLQIHDVESQPYDLVMHETLPALERLQQDGKIRFIGVSTRDLPLLMTFMKTERFDAIQFYTRYMLADHTAKDDVLPLAKELGLGVINGSVLGMGILAESPAPFLDEETLVRAQERLEKLNFLRKTEPLGLIEPGMRFSLSQPDIHVTLTGADTTAILRTNLSYCDGRGLDPGDQEKVYQLFQGQSLFR